MELDLQTTEADDEHRGPPGEPAVEWCGEVDADELVFRSYGIMPTGVAALDVSLAPSCLSSPSLLPVDDLEETPMEAPPPVTRQKRYRETVEDGRVVRKDLGVGVTHPSWGVEFLE